MAGDEPALLNIDDEGHDDDAADDDDNDDDDNDDDDNDDDIYIMMKCVFVCVCVTKNHHFPLPS